eukprot:1176283-Prorocentrum_minimum.AAC.3
MVTTRRSRKCALGEHNPTVDLSAVMPYCGRTCSHHRHHPYRTLHTELHCTALHCTALHCAAPHGTGLHWTLSFCNALHCAVLYLHAGVLALQEAVGELLVVPMERHRPHQHRHHHRTVSPPNRPLQVHLRGSRTKAPPTRLVTKGSQPRPLRGYVDERHLGFRRQRSGGYVQRDCPGGAVYQHGQVRGSPPAPHDSALIADPTATGCLYQHGQASNSYAPLAKSTQASVGSTAIATTDLNGSRTHLSSANVAPSRDRSQGRAARVKVVPVSSSVHRNDMEYLRHSHIHIHIHSHSHS